MVKILVNDGIHPDGKLLLEEADYIVDEERIPQEELPARIAEYDVLIVRSATKVTKAVIDAGKNLKIIARGGVGLDNIDVEYAQSKGIEVVNTPQASSRAVAELAIAHLFGLSRMMHRSNRELSAGGDFKKLKKAYETGFQIRGKTLGVIGFGRIGQEVAKIGLGIGMNVRAHDPFVQEAEIGLQLHSFEDLKFNVRITTEPMERILREADFLTFHLPGGGQPLIGAAEFSRMKTGVFLINTARGGVIDEEALLAALDSGKVAGAGLDVYENEPSPREALLRHPEYFLYAAYRRQYRGSPILYRHGDWPIRSSVFLETNDLRFAIGFPGNTRWRPSATGVNLPRGFDAPSRMIRP